jgi:hypothetical protein
MKTLRDREKTFPPSPRATLAGSPLRPAKRGYCSPRLETRSGDALRALLASANAATGFIPSP